MIELGLPFGFAIEFNALYHRNGYLIGHSNFAGSVIESERANSWGFPILLKYKLPVSKVKPFVEVGLAPRSISGTISESGVSVNVLTGSRRLSAAVQKPIGAIALEWSLAAASSSGWGVCECRPRFVTHTGPASTGSSATGRLTPRLKSRWTC
jgi:hypothetical protein